MKRVNAVAIVLLFMSAHAVQANALEYTFVDEKTGHKLSVDRGTVEDFIWAKEFCGQFFKPLYEIIPLDADQKQYGSFEAFIDAKFSAHYAAIFTENKYEFFIVKDCDVNKYVGYTIVDIIDNRVFSLETQAAIATYGVKSLMSGLALFIKNKVANNAEYFISAVRKTMPQFVETLKACDFSEGEGALLHPTLPQEYYQALIRKL